MKWFLFGFLTYPLNILPVISVLNIVRPDVNTNREGNSWHLNSRHWCHLGRRFSLLSVAKSKIHSPHMLQELCLNNLCPSVFPSSVTSLKILPHVEKKIFHLKFVTFRHKISPSLKKFILIVHWIMTGYQTSCNVIKILLIGSTSYNEIKGKHR